MALTSPHLTIATVGDAATVRVAAEMLQRLLAAAKLPRFVEAAMATKPVDGLTSCHEHAGALAMDLHAGGVGGWSVVLGRTAQIKHSWLEHGHAAVDVTLDRKEMVGKIMVASSVWYRETMGIVNARRFDAHRKRDLSTYLRLTGEA